MVGTIKVALECFKGFVVTSKSLKRLGGEYLYLLLCPLASELSPAPEFRGISRIWEFSENSTENSTEFLCYFQNWSKMLQKASECYQILGKAPKIAQNFYIFVKSA